MADQKLYVSYRCNGISRAKHGDARFDAALKARKLVGGNLRAALASGVIGCGFDMTPTINDVPQDGDDYVVECPYCGAETSVMRTPEGES